MFNQSDSQKSNQQVIGVFFKSPVGIIEYVINQNIKNAQAYYDEKSGIDYFVTDPEPGFDLTSNPPLDILLLPRSTEATRDTYISYIEASNPEARIFIDNEDTALFKHEYSRKMKIFTYSFVDPKSNFFIKKLKERQGKVGWNFSLCFQARPQKTFWQAVFLPIMYRTVEYRSGITCTDVQRIQDAIKAFIIAMALSLDPNPVTYDIGAYDFSQEYADSTVNNQ